MTQTHGLDKPQWTRVLEPYGIAADRAVDG
jgi:hypothetical protein